MLLIFQDNVTGQNGEMTIYKILFDIIYIQWYNGIQCKV